MAFGLPAYGETNWHTKLNDSISAVKATADAAETPAGAQSKVDAHTGDATAAHPASAVSVTPTGGIAATDVQAAVAELDTDKAPRISYDRMVCSSAGAVVSINSTTLAVLTFLGNPVEVSVPAVAGDVLNIGLNAQLADNAAGFADFGAATFNGAVELNRIPSAGSPAIPGWGFRNTAAYDYIAASVRYVVQASDIVGGSVTIRLMGFYAAAVRTLFADAPPLVFDVTNLGS